MCDRSPPYSWVNSTEELAQYIALVTQRQIALDTTVAPYNTEKLPSLIEEIPCRCEHGQFLRSVRPLLRNQHCCSVAVYQLKQTYTLGRMHQQLLKPFNLFLSDYPTLDEHDMMCVEKNG